MRNKRGRMRLKANVTKLPPGKANRKRRSDALGGTTEEEDGRRPSSSTLTSLRTLGSYFPPALIRREIWKTYTSVYIKLYKNKASLVWFWYKYKRPTVRLPTSSRDERHLFHFTQPSPEARIHCQTCFCVGVVAIFAIVIKSFNQKFRFRKDQIQGSKPGSMSGIISFVQNLFSNARFPLT